MLTYLDRAPDQLGSFGIGPTINGSYNNNSINKNY